MLRQIVSVSLVMTACATLIPTKVNAVTLTVVPVNGLERSLGDEMKFLLVLDPSIPGSTEVNRIRYEAILSTWQQDPTELSRRGQGIEKLIDVGYEFSSPTTIATFTFDVFKKPIKDGDTDLFNLIAFYRVPFLNEEGKTEYGEYTPVVASNIVDVVPVPEPLTIFGTVMALGGGVLLKRKSFKMKKS